MGIAIFFKSLVVGSFPAFRPRFAGKCDRQSSGLTQFTSGDNFAVKPTTYHLDRHARTHT